MNNEFCGSGFRVFTVQNLAIYQNQPKVVCPAWGGFMILSPNGCPILEQARKRQAEFQPAFCLGMIAPDQW